VPVDPERVDEFDPDAVPTVGQLLVELNQVPAETGDDKVWRLVGESIACS
jgi:DNA primase small subunit